MIPNTTKFANILEDTPTCDDFRTPQPESPVVQQASITHIDETILPEAIESAIRSGCKDAKSSRTALKVYPLLEEADNLGDRNVDPLDCGQPFIKVVDDETSYGLLGSASLNEYLCNSASSTKQMPLPDVGAIQQSISADFITVSSTPSSIPAPTAIESLPCSLQDPSVRAREVQKILDASAFISSNISAGSTLGLPSDVASTDVNDGPSQRLFDTSQGDMAPPSPTFRDPLIET